MYLVLRTFISFLIELVFISFFLYKCHRSHMIGSDRTVLSRSSMIDSEQAVFYEGKERVHNNSFYI